MRTCLVYKHNAYPLGGICQAGCYFSKHAPKERSSLTGCTSDVEAHLHYLADGGVFVDNRPCDVTAHMLWMDPGLDMLLPPGMVRRFAEQDIVPLSGYTPRSFDDVALDIYLATWRGRGARIGVRKGDFMHWDDGVIAPVPECRCWVSTCVGCGRFRYYVDRASCSAYASARVPSGPDDHCPECRAKGR